MRSEGDLQDRIAALIAPTAEHLGYDLVRVRVMGGTRVRLQIMAERPDGTMTIDDCEILSRAVSARLDVEDPIRGEYVLEVSSPGLDRPLVRRRDYERFEGHEAKIELLRAQEDGRRRFRGVLTGIEDDTVLLTDEDGGSHRLPLSLIEEAKLVLTDALIAATLKAQKKGAEGQAIARDGMEMDVDDLERPRASRKPSNGQNETAKPRAPQKARRAK